MVHSLVAPDNGQSRNHDKAAARKDTMFAIYGDDRESATDVADSAGSINNLSTSNKMNDSFGGRRLTMRKADWLAVGETDFGITSLGSESHHNFQQQSTRASLTSEELALQNRFSVMNVISHAEEEPPQFIMSKLLSKRHSRNGHDGDAIEDETALNSLGMAETDMNDSLPSKSLSNVLNAATEVEDGNFGDVVVMRKKKLPTETKKGPTLSMYSRARASQVSVSLRESQFFGGGKRKSLVFDMDKDISVDDPSAAPTPIKRFSFRQTSEHNHEEEVERAKNIATTRKVKLSPRICEQIIPMDKVMIGRKLATDYFGTMHEAVLLTTPDQNGVKGADLDDWEDAHEEVAVQETQLVINLISREIDGKLCQSYLNEASVLLAIQHPNLLRVFGVVVEPTLIGVLSEYLPMTSVRDWLLQVRTTPSISWSSVIPIIVDLSRQTANGLDCLEKRGIVHRDLSKF